jgi:peptidyl-prolyl cis-trans isomerase C
LLQEMIQQEALVQRAKNAGLNKDPQLAHEIENLLIGKFLEHELTKQIEAVKITPEEVKADYESNIAKYTQPAKARLAILFLEAGARSSDAKRAETRARLNEARAKFQENPEAARRTSPAPGFGALAVDYSDDQASRYRSGDIGWLEAGNFAYRWPKAVLEAGHALEKNQLSDVIETASGFYLVMKTDARPGSVMPLEKIEAQLRESVLLKKRRELDESFRKESIRIAGVAIHTNTLQAVQLPAANPALAKSNDAGPPSFPLLGETPRATGTKSSAQPTQKTKSL